MNEEAKIDTSCAIDKAAVIRKRSNCECILELAIEMDQLEDKRIKLKKAIDANPSSVRETAKSLWPLQLDAMNAYKKALQKRILDLIENDDA